MLTKILATTLKYNMLDYRDHVIIGLSGGADSVALLHGLLYYREKFDLRLTAVHVNHGLRGLQADEDEQFVIRACQALDMPLSVFHYDIAKAARDMKTGLEEAGRNMRYQAFAETMASVNAQKIAIAHNRNDNAETILMRLFRGTGLKGMSGIPPVRDAIIRPLIETGRAEIEHYLTEQQIAYVTDQTNRDACYTRNKIRLQVLPLIQSEIGPHVTESLSRGAAIAFEEDSYLQQIAEEAFDQCSLRHSPPTSPTLCIAALRTYPDAIKRRIIRLGIAKCNPSLRDISYTHVQDAMALMNKETGKSVDLPNGLYVRREYNCLLFLRKENKKEAYCYDLRPGMFVFVKEINKYIHMCPAGHDTQPPSNLKCLCTKEINYDRIKNGLQIRPRRPGDRVHIANIGSKKLKDYFIDAKLPREQRDNIPLIAHGSDILWILDEKNIANHSYRAIDGSRKTALQLWGETDARNSESIGNGSGN